MIIMLKLKLHDYKIPTIVTNIIGPGMSRWGENFMNVQNAHVNVHVVYLIFDLADIPSRSVSRYGLTSPLRLSYSRAEHGELTPHIGIIVKIAKPI